MRHMTELESSALLAKMGLTHPTMDEMAMDQEPTEDRTEEEQQIIDTSADIVFKD